jgi:hypothetical protein
MVMVGICTIEASQSGDSAYLPAISVTQDIVILKAAQTIDFPTQSPFFQNFVVSGAYALNPAATASSTLAVGYTVLTPAVCAFNASTSNVTMITAGQCVIQASQPGDVNFQPAAPVSQVVLQIVEPPFGQRTIMKWAAPSQQISKFCHDLKLLTSESNQTRHSWLGTPSYWPRRPSLLLDSLWITLVWTAVYAPLAELWLL